MFFRPKWGSVTGSFLSFPLPGPEPMAKPSTPPLERFARQLALGLRQNQVVFWLLAVAAGVLVTLVVIGFRETILLVQTGFFGISSERFHSAAASLAWWHLALAPVLGGLVVGLLIRWLLPDGRPQGIADVIELAAVQGAKGSLRTGLAGALTSAVTLGAGASAGREGPAIHLGAHLGGWLGARLGLNRRMTLTLLASGVAAAVAASFNAPIAGILFALEVVVGRYAMSAFGPVVLAAVSATIVARLQYGDFPAFVIPSYAIGSLWNFALFMGLGLAAGLVSVALARAIFFARDLSEKTPLPVWARPALGGLGVGLIAIWLPQIMGVGYEATDLALQESFTLGLLLALLVAKIVATGLTLGFGFAGGVFSPSLFLGAMLGGAFGLVSQAVLPGLGTTHGLYALVGMGAVAAAVMGAPISTILIMFELTGDYSLTLAVMVAVVVSVFVNDRLLGGSFFFCQMKERGIDPRDGRESEKLRGVKVADLIVTVADRVGSEAGLKEMETALKASRYGQLLVVDRDGLLIGTIGREQIHDLEEDVAGESSEDGGKARDIARRHPTVLVPGETLKDAMELFQSGEEGLVPVVESRENMRFLGIIRELDVVRRHNRALLEVRAEERGEA